MPFLPASIFLFAFQADSPRKLENDTFTMVVQVNGKVRGKIEINSNTTEEEMKEHAMRIDNVKTFTEGKEIIKVIVVPKKLVNIVIK